MYKFGITCLVILLCAFGVWCAVQGSFRQAQSQVKYQNPKYMKDVVVFTGRTSRRDSYRTNMTGTILVPFGNNVTYATRLAMTSGGDFRIEAKVCDTVKSKWMRDFMSTFTNLTLSKCPFPPGRYRYMNMELPPKNIPLPITDGDYNIHFVLYVTATKEPILDIAALLHFDQNQKTRIG